jgi:hypothetical protein
MLEVRWREGKEELYGRRDPPISLCMMDLSIGWLTRSSQG